MLPVPVVIFSETFFGGADSGFGGEPLLHPPPFDIEGGLRPFNRVREGSVIRGAVNNKGCTIGMGGLPAIMSGR